jgi:DNA replication protein DnaC
MYMPGGTQMFDRMLVAAHGVLRLVLVENEMMVDEMPAALYTQLQRQSEKKVKDHAKDVRDKLAKITVHRVAQYSTQTQIPSADSFANATQERPLHNPIRMQKAPRQSTESHAEQEAAFNTVMESVLRYREASSLQAKAVCIVGPPGTGKTFVMSSLILQTMALGLWCCVAALMAERLLVLGGIYLHKLFEIPVHESATPHRMAELALLRLYKNPLALYILQTIDVLFVDELGQLPAQLMSVLDIILRRIRNSNQYMGGVLLISTMDPQQLRPMNGLPAMLSPFIITCFKL